MKYQVMMINCEVILFKSHVVHRGLMAYVSLHQCSLVPRPHPQEGKRSGELGLNPWAYASEFPLTNQITALAQSCDSPTTGMQQRHCLLYKFELPTKPCQPIRSGICFNVIQHSCGGAHTRPKDSAQVYQTFFLARGSQGLGTRLTLACQETIGYRLKSIVSPTSVYNMQHACILYSAQC